MSYYYNRKDRIPDYLKCHIVDEFWRPACNAGYIGETEWNLDTRRKECCMLGKNSPIFNHLAESNLFQYILTLHSFPWYGDVILTNQYILEHISITVKNNVRTIGKAKNWAELCFLESLNIKCEKASLKTCIKAKNGLVLFS